MRSSSLKLAAVLAVGGGCISGCGSGGGGGAPGSGNTATVHLLTQSIPSATTGEAYSAQFQAQVPHAPAIFHVAAGTLPPGLRLDPATGKITGFPRQVGSFHFDLVVRDGIDYSLPPGRDATFAEDRKTFTVPVALGAPHILPQVLPGAQYRSSYGYPIDVAGGTSPLSFAVTGGSLPAGISVSSTGFVGLFPTEARQDPYLFQVTVTDSRGLTDTAGLSLQVVVLPLIIGTANPIPQAAAWFPYDLQVTLATPGGGVPYTWGQAALLPGETDLFSIGMQVTQDGHLKDLFGGPTAVGSFTFTLQVTDEPLQVATRQLTLQVNPGPVLTVITPNRSTSPGPYVVTGLNFQPGAQLVLKPGPTEIVVTPVFVDATRLQVNSAMPRPANSGGAIPVLVRNPDGGSFTKPAAFIFPASSISYGSKGFLSSALSSTGLDAADVDGDGRADVVHAGASGLTPYGGGAASTTGGLLLHMNLGGTPPAFSTVSLDAGNYYDVKFVDVNLDGRLDVLALGQTTLRTWLNGVSGNPLGTFTAGPITTLPSGFSWPSEMAVGRLNNDAIPDVAFGVPHYPTANVNGRVYSMLGQGNGAFSALDAATTSILNTYGVNSIVCVDSDGDGRAEVAAGVGMNPSSGPMLNLSATSAGGSSVRGRRWGARSGLRTTGAPPASPWGTSSARAAPRSSR